MNDRFLSLRQRWDVLAAVALVGLAFVPGVERQGVDLAVLPDRTLDTVGWVLLVTQGAAVALLRRWPAVPLAVVGTAFGVYQLLGYPTTFAALGMLVAVVGAGALIRNHRWATLVSAAVGYTFLSMALAWAGSPTGTLGYVTFGTLLASLWAVGSWLGSRTQAEEHRRVEAARVAVYEERGRITRELHDVITHHVTAMVVQADSAQYGTNDTQQTKKLFSLISETGRDALTDLRGLLKALDGAADKSTSSPAVAGVEELVARARAGGQPVELLQEGEPRALHTASALAVTRVVQESLTNAMKHANGAATQVHVRYEEKEIELTVTTHSITGRGLGRGSGRGLIGLSERIALVGGSFEAGPVGAGFVVKARILA